MGLQMAGEKSTHGTHMGPNILDKIDPYKWNANPPEKRSIIGFEGIFQVLRILIHQPVFSLGYMSGMKYLQYTHSSGDYFHKA